MPYYVSHDSAVAVIPLMAAIMRTAYFIAIDAYIEVGDIDVRKVPLVKSACGLPRMVGTL
jgi:hypothetical protein